MSKSNAIAKRSSKPGSKTATLTTRQSGTTYLPSQVTSLGEWLTLLRAASPANPTQQPDSGEALLMSATSGHKPATSSAEYDQATRSWRTYQASFTESGHSSRQSLETWPRSGMTRNGALYPLPELAPLTFVGAGGAWPTPKASPEHYGQPRENDWGDLQAAVRAWPTPNARVSNDGERPATWLTRRRSLQGKAINGNGMGMPLSIAVQLYPTPTASDGHGPGVHGEGSMDLRTFVGGLLNPRWVEWLMGIPVGWTSLEPLAADKYQEWWQSFCGALLDRKAN